jgi:hypothetical protein
MVQRLARWASSTVPDRNAAHQAALPLAACGGAAPRQSMARPRGGHSVSMGWPGFVLIGR